MVEDNKDISLFVFIRKKIGVPHKKFNNKIDLIYYLRFPSTLDNLEMSTPKISKIENDYKNR